MRGWRERLRLKPTDVIPELEPFCSEFLSTFVDNEGTMKGTDLRWFLKLRSATSLPITAAGGIRTMREVKTLEKAGINAAVGMAIYTGKLAGRQNGPSAAPMHSRPSLSGLSARCMATDTSTAAPVAQLRPLVYSFLWCGIVNGGRFFASG